MPCESSVIRSIIDELDSWDIQRDQMESESGVSRSIIDELHSSYIQGAQWKVKVVLPKVPLIKFILRISKEIE